MSSWRYIIGNPNTRFAVTKRPDFQDAPTGASLPWRWPKGGWRLGPVIVWWSK
jgi:hypothetical protein